MPTDDGHLTVWTVYDHPTDFPDVFVARQWHILPEGPVPTERVLTSHSLDEIRDELGDLGGVPLYRNEEDDPKIIESWI